MTSPQPVNQASRVEYGEDLVILTFAADEERTGDNMITNGLVALGEDVGSRHLLLDFRNITYLTSVELGTLVSLHKDMKGAGGRLSLFNLECMVFEVFKATRLETLLDICRSRPEGPRRHVSPPCGVVPARKNDDESA